MKVRVDLLVIGASGQDGRYMLEQARERGFRVIGTSRRSIPHLARLDPCNDGELVALLSDVSPKKVVLLAGQSSVGRSFADPEGTIRSHTVPLQICLDWIHANSPDTRLIYAASGECFGPNRENRPASERTAFNPQNPYAEGKARGADMVRKYRRKHDLEVANAFLFNHESPLRPAQFVFGKVLEGINRLKADPSGDPIVLGNLRNVRDWGWAPDYTSAMLDMAEMECLQDLVLATGRSISLREAIGSLVASAGFRFNEVIAAQTALDAHAQRADCQYANPARAREMIGWAGSTAFPALAQKLLAEH